MFPSLFPCWFSVPPGMRHFLNSKILNPRASGPFFCQNFFSLYPLIARGGKNLWWDIAVVKEEEKRNTGSTHPGGNTQPLSPSAASPGGSKPCPCLRHSRCRDPAQIPVRSSTHSCSPSIHQDNPIKSFTGRTWRWQQHIITNISSLYMVIIYSIFFYQCNTDRRLFYA